mgnify:CR=1 FL=1
MSIYKPGNVEQDPNQDSSADRIFNKFVEERTLDELAQILGRMKPEYLRILNEAMDLVGKEEKKD